MRKLQIRRFITLLLLGGMISGCSQSQDRLKADGRAAMAELAACLEGVESIDELIEKKNDIQELFAELVDCAIALRKKELQSGVAVEVTQEDNCLAERLKNAIGRLSRIPGAKALLEVYQEPSLEKIDTFEGKLKKAQGDAERG